MDARNVIPQNDLIELANNLNLDCSHYTFNPDGDFCSMYAITAETGWAGKTIFVPKVADIAESLCKIGLLSFICRAKTSKVRIFASLFSPFFAFGLARKRAVLGREEKGRNLARLRWLTPASKRPFVSVSMCLISLNLVFTSRTSINNLYIIISRNGYINSVECN
jgi:hypothetical protein